jgi:hypothetical protein
MTAQLAMGMPKRQALDTPRKRDSTRGVAQTVGASPQDVTLDSFDLASGIATQVETKLG